LEGRHKSENSTLCVSKTDLNTVEDFSNVSFGYGVFSLLEGLAYLAPVSRGLEGFEVVSVLSVHSSLDLAVSVLRESADSLSIAKSK